MKHKILALTIASIFAAGAANAATVMKADNGDYLKIYGGAEIGGTIVSDKDKTPFGPKKTFVNDSFLTIGAKGQTEDIYFKFEIDAEHQDWTETNSMRLVIDKAYVGYKLSKTQSIEAGRTDTAYDHYDAFGDYTNELSAEVSEAGDQDETLKYQAQFGDIKVGISHSLKGWDVETAGGHDYITDSREGKVTNGYVGYFTKGFTVLAAAETVDKRGEIYSIHGEAKLDKLSLGGFVSVSDRRGGEAKDANTYVLSSKYKLTDKLSLLASANVVSPKASGKDDSTWGVIGAEYKYAKNIKLAAEIAQGDVLENQTTEAVESGTLGYVKAFYWF